MEDQLKELSSLRITDQQQSNTCPVMSHMANIKWQTGQSGLHRTLGQVIQKYCCKHECTTATQKNANSQFASFRFHKQTAQTSCFTFQNNNFNSKNSSKLLCSTKTQPSLSSLASSQTISSSLTGSKNQLELSHRISL